MRNYLIFAERAKAFREDPEVAQALRDSRVDSLALPALSRGETLADLDNDTFDPDEAAKRGMHYERLDQLALDHLFAAR
jgi:xylose isomerase